MLAEVPCLVCFHSLLLTSKLAPLLALTNQDDDNNDDEHEEEEEVDHSELETLLQEWLAEKAEEEENAEDIEDGLELVEVATEKDVVNDKVDEPADQDTLLSQTINNKIEVFYHQQSQ